jgi:hypothetical protein
MCSDYLSEEWKGEDKEKSTYYQCTGNFCCDDIGRWIITIGEVLWSDATPHHLHAQHL